MRSAFLYADALCCKITEVKKKGESMRDLKQKAIRSQIVYQGAIFNVRKDEAVMANDRPVSREVVEHYGVMRIAASCWNTRPGKKRQMKTRW